VTMRRSGTVTEIWLFEFLPGRLFQEQSSVVGRSSVGRSVLSITLISCTPLEYRSKKCDINFYVYLPEKENQLRGKTLDSYG